MSKQELEITEAVKHVDDFENVYTPETAPGVVESGAVISKAFETEDGLEATYGIVQPGTKAKFPADERGERLTLQQGEGLATELHLRMTSPDGIHTMIGGMNDELQTWQVPGGWEIELNHPSDAEPAAYICEYTTPEE